MTTCEWLSVSASSSSSCIGATSGSSRSIRWSRTESVAWYERLVVIGARLLGRQGRSEKTLPATAAAACTRSM